jgi:hypothetical protein
MGLLPPNRGQGAPWRYEPHNGMFMPNVACSCHEDVRLGITPDECNRHLKSMIAAGHVSEVQIGGLIAQIKGARR